MKKQTGKAKRGLTMLLCASMVISVTPSPVMAEENFTSEEAWAENPQTEEVSTFEDETTEENWITEEADTDELEEELFIENFESGNEENAQIIGDTITQFQAGAEENDSEIAVQANDSAGKTEQQSTDEASVTINGTTLYYATLEEAFSAADGKTATITMLNDAECINYAGVPFCVDSWESDITLKMNGKTLTGLGKEDCGAITVKEGSLAIQGPGRILSLYKGLSCERNAREIAVENVTFDLHSCKYGIWVDSMYPVILDNVQVYERADEGAVYINNSSANVTINNMSALGRRDHCDVVYRGNPGLIINGGTFDKISDCYNETSVSNILGEGCIYRNNEDKTWVKSDLSNTYEISNVTVEKIPLTINPAAEATPWYYNSAEHSLQMNAQPTTTGNEITYEWYDGDKKLECTSDTYTVPKTMPIGNYTYTCKATCDGYTLSHEFTFTVEECKHEGIEITFNSNGFGNCPKCNATVYQPATETTDKYDIDDDGTKDTVYEISNAGQLYWFAGLVNGTLDGVEQNTLANAILTANITVNENLLDSLQYDAEGNVSNGSDFITWTPIADCMEDHTTQYSGTFDGNNKTVSGLYLNGNSARIGLFGSSEADGNIKNVGVVDSYFKGNDFVGGVCGRNDGTITNCYNAGNLTAIDPTAAIGGICGYNGKGGTIANCYNTGTVTATGSVASVGGVCGCSLAPISNCYNIGTVTATSSGADISGICGYNFGPVTNCYYLADTEDENGGKTAAQFASGEIAYLLSQGCTVGEGEGENAVTYSGSVWGQALGENGDTYPVLKKAGDVENTVYRNETYPGCEGKPGDLVYSYSNTQKAPTYAEHTDEDLDGKCDVGGEDFKTYNQLGKLITKVKQNLSDGKYADVQYTTASIDALRKAIVVADTITEASSDTDVATGFDKLLAASTVGADGLIAADHNIVISFANSGVVRGIASGNGWYANGDTVTLKVTPRVGYSFSKWTKDTAGNKSVGTESTYTFTLGANSPDAYYAWLDEVKYTVTCESVEGGTGKASEEQYVYGQTATVTATANDNYEFVGWKDSYGTTVSTDAVYNFTVIGDATLTPEFVKVKTNEGADIAYVTVSFYHQSGKLLDSQKVVSGEGKITNTVNAPTKVGFDFLGWSAKASGATAEDVVDFKTATFSENTSLYPVFKAQDITYTLTVVGLQPEQKAPQSSVTVTADPIEGKQFVGWKDANGNIVSYDSTYTFIITGDTTLEACYEQADSKVVKEPTIIIAQPTYEDITGGYKMAFYFNYTVPEDCELVDIGIIRKKGDYEADGITLETVGISRYSVLSKLGSEGQFYYTKSNYYGTGHTVTGYMIYEKNGIRYTVYSDSIYGVKNN